MQMTLAIELQQVTKSFGETRAVQHLNLEIPSGSLCGFLGPNGAGKSTTIRMIMSIIHPDSGSISVLGTNALAAKDRIGYLPEERGVYRKMKVGRFIEYIAHLKGMRGSSLRKQVDQWLERIELPNVRNKKFEELSKGMQQKVQFLAAIIHEPELIILDEPFTGLDPVNTQLIGGIVHDLRRAGTTILFSTHVLPQAEEICDRIVMIDNGIKVIDDQINAVRNQFDPNIVQVMPIDPTVDFLQFNGVQKQDSANKDGEINLYLDENASQTAIIGDIARSVPLRGIQVMQPTLTDIFIHQIATNKGDEAAEKTREQLTNA
jgi:ABC-2 type transport system ATP-binding protein